MSDEEVIQIAEKDIDIAYSANGLKDIGYTQAVWTLLSVAEDHNLKIREIQQLSDFQRDAYVDGLINWLSYPLRVCFKEADRKRNKLIKALVDEHYQLAQDWIKKSKEYSHFCAIFPLWWRKKIKISVDGRQLLPTDWSSASLEYEAYNRLVRKSGDVVDKSIDQNQVV